MKVKNIDKSDKILKIESVIFIFIFLGILLICILLIFFEIHDLNDLMKISLEDKIEISKTFATTLGGSAFILNLYYLGKQKESLEKTAIAAIQNAQSAEEKQITERYSKAVEQLGHEEIYVQTGAIYALERIAKDSDKDYWQIMEILTAYVRQKYLMNKEPLVSITIDIQAALTVIVRLSKNYKSRQEYPINLTNANINGANLQNANFEGANLEGVNLENANLEGANLENANLKGANLKNANLERANLENAKLAKASLIKVNFQKAILKNTDLSSLDFKKSDFSFANLSGANFNNSWIQDVNFTGADLSGAILIEAKTFINEEGFDDNYEIISTFDEFRGEDGSYRRFYSTNFKGTNFKDSDLSYANLIAVSNLQPEQVKLAKNWNKAIFKIALSKELGISDNQEDF